MAWLVRNSERRRLPRDNALTLPVGHLPHARPARHAVNSCSIIDALGILVVYPRDHCCRMETASCIVFFLSVQMSTDCGVEGIIINIRQSPSDDSRKRLFELATTNSRTYFTASQVRVYPSVVFIVQLQATSSGICVFLDFRTNF